MAPENGGNLSNANKPRVGVRLRESMAGAKSSNRIGELDALKDKYKILEKHFKQLEKNLKQRHAAMVSVGQSRSQLANTIAAMSEDTPLEKCSGIKSEGSSHDKAMETANYADTMRALASSSQTRADDFQEKACDYVRKWQDAVTTRCNAEIKRTENLRRDADHYDKKVDSLELAARKLREKGKEVPAANADKLQRNREKLEEANRLYQHAAKDLFLLLEEVVERSWRDLHPLFMRLLQLEISFTSDEYNLIQSDLKSVMSQLKQVGTKNQINGQRLDQLENSSPKNLSTRPNPSMVNLNFGTDKPEQAPKPATGKPTGLLPKKNNNDNKSSSSPWSGRQNNNKRNVKEDDSDSSVSSSSSSSVSSVSVEEEEEKKPRRKFFGGAKNDNVRGADQPRVSRNAPGRAAKTASQHHSTHREEDEYAEADPSKWKLTKQQFSGSFVYETKGKEEEVVGQPISKGIDKIKNQPEKYLLLFFQSNMTDWPVDQQRYILIHREGSKGYKPKGVSPKGFMTLYMQEYEALTPLKDNILQTQYRDDYTDNMKFQGRRLHSKTNKPIMPGRGMGCADTPLLKIIGDVDPSDIHQGMVGDCWLLSGISSLAEFDGAVKKLFRKTSKLEQRPLDGPNKYTVTLWDLETWSERDIVIDERLAASPDGTGQLLSTKPSEDGELWVCYLEKALAIHCGGWDKITGGQCTHAWSLLTGCKEQYTIKKNPKTGKFQCFGKYNPYERRWARHGNSPHDGEQSLWQMDWPRVGGGGSRDLELTEEEVFQRMCAWDDTNYIVGAGCSDSGADGGLVDNHAYSVIEAHNDVAGTDIDLLKIRNPWGKGEIEDGMFDDDGPGWTRYPQIKKALNPVVADDGIFYVTKHEFFIFFSTIYLSASDMTDFLED